MSPDSSNQGRSLAAAAVMPLSLSQTFFVFSFFFFRLIVAQFNSTPPTIPPDAAIQRAANISTGNPAQRVGDTTYFPQAIDHATFNGNYSDPDSTFLQQYQVNDTYYKPGGPIIFFQSTESAEMICLEHQIVPEWAQELSALMVVIEHRYFGISCPYGLNYSDYPSWNPTLLKPLTLENALLDGISLLRWIKEVAYPSAKDAKVLVESGTLVTWCKLPGIYCISSSIF